MVLQLVRHEAGAVVLFKPLAHVSVLDAMKGRRPVLVLCIEGGPEPQQQLGGVDSPIPSQSNRNLGERAKRTKRAHVRMEGFATEWLESDGSAFEPARENEGGTPCAVLRVNVEPLLHD